MKNNSTIQILKNQQEQKFKEKVQNDLTAVQNQNDSFGRTSPKDQTIAITFAMDAHPKTEG